jgi:lysozyme
MKISQEAIDQIKKFEGFKSKAYLDAVGIPTIGYGHISGVKLKDVCTEEQAEEFLKQDLIPGEEAITKLVKVDLNQGQWDSLLDFCFNLGVGSFSRSSLLRLLNERKFSEAAEEFDKWIYGGHQILPGLITRRNWEKRRFLGLI